MEVTDTAFTAFLAETQKIERDAATLWPLAPAFAQLAAGGFFTRWLNRHLATMRDPETPAGLWFLPDFTVHQGDGFRVGIRAVQAGGPIQTASEAAIWVPLDPNGLSWRRYRPTEHENDVFDSAVRLVHGADGATAPGEALCADPADIYEFTHDGGRFAAVLTLPVARSLNWTFDRRSLYAHNAGDARTADTLMRAACDVLGHLRDPSSADVLEALATDPHFGVRWSAVQNLAKIIGTNARPVIERAALDPHPRIRTAAGDALRQLDRNQDASR